MGISMVLGARFPTPVRIAFLSSTFERLSGPPPNLPASALSSEFFFKRSWFASPTVGCSATTKISSLGFDPLQSYVFLISRFPAAFRRYSDFRSVTEESSRTSCSGRSLKTQVILNEAPPDETQTSDFSAVQ